MRDVTGYEQEHETQQPKVALLYEKSHMLDYMR